MQGLWTPDFRDIGDGVSWQPPASERVVQSSVVDDWAKERGKCAGIAEDTWAGKLSDRLDDVAQT